MRKIVFAWYGPCGRGEGKEQRKTVRRRLGNGHACVYKLFLFSLESLLATKMFDRKLSTLPNLFIYYCY